MKAILSDIHSNLEALQAVLEDAARHGAQEFYCLGDVVGYGPNPRECLDLAMRWGVVLRGNHEQAVLSGPAGFNPVAELATFWTQEQLSAPVPDRQAADARWEFLRTRPASHQEGGLLFTHASPRDPVNDYLFPHDTYDLRKMQDIFARVGHCCFHGHTHLPGIFAEVLAGGVCQFFSPEQLGYAYRLGGRKALCNVGSVGQPRDTDWRACYVLLDGDTVHFRRVEYDVETTFRKIKDTPGLDDALGERLLLGR
jgi:diadenosine tetraphosphatase ApaH/serine/threonine PP2A family protein phosphatase